MPNRILKETICTSDTLDVLDEAEENLFYRLMVQCDDYGRMDARPAILRARCYPLRLDTVTDDDIRQRLAALERAGLVWIYEVDGRPYLQMTTWEKHQQRRAKHSKYPQPPADSGPCKQLIADAGNCKQLPANVSEESRSEESRSEESRNRDNEDEESGRSSSSDFVQDAIRIYENSIGMITDAIQSEQIKDTLTELEKRGLREWWKEAVGIACDNNKRSWSYVRGILENSLRDGRAPARRDRPLAPPGPPQKKVVTITDPQTGEERAVEMRL